MKKSKVSIVKTKQNPGANEIAVAVRKALDLIGGIKGIVKRGNLVLINPNWAAPPVEREKAVITDPDVAKAVADIVREQGARAVIAESSAVGVDTTKVIEASGYKTLRDQGYEVVDLKKTKIVKVPFKDGWVLKELETFELVQQADVIVSLPKMKTHDQADMTGPMKNLKGLLSDKYKRLLHQEFGVFEGCVDITAFFKPAFSVVDAILCQEGLGPIYGKPVEMDLILAGRDMVAIESVCGQIAGFEPGELPIPKYGAERGLGNLYLKDIDIVGEKIESVKRRFMRVQEDDPVQVEGFNLIFGGVTCTGCRNTVLSALADMRNGDQLVYLPGVTVITGDPLIPVGVPEDSLVAVGKCVPKTKRGERFAPGCPPSNAFVVDAIIGGREKVKRRYAEEGRTVGSSAELVDEDSKK
jgi:uncharacterized protein (DUF362 family)